MHNKKIELSTIIRLDQSINCTFKSFKIDNQVTYKRALPWQIYFKNRRVEVIY